jgi:hypothetical protein
MGISPGAQAHSAFSDSSIGRITTLGAHTEEVGRSDLAELSTQGLACWSLADAGSGGFGLSLRLTIDNGLKLCRTWSQSPSGGEVCSRLTPADPPGRPGFTAST